MNLDTRVAIIFGKGLDGCGVEKYAREWQKQVKQCSIFVLEERSFVRGGVHVKDYETFTQEDIDDLTKKLNENYDIVILNSLPSHKHDKATVDKFYHDLVCKIEDSILIYVNHEIIISQVNIIPYHVAICNAADVIYGFSVDNDFCKHISSMMNYKKDRLKKFTIPLDMNFRENPVPFEDKRNSIVYTGRFSSMKKPQYLLNYLNHKKSLGDTSLPDAQIIGIEKSIGAAVNLLNIEGCKYKKNTLFKLDKFLDDVKSGCNVFAPYKYEDGQEVLAHAKFGFSGFNLKRAHNYGDRLEYSQIEIILNGTVPIFHKHLGENCVGKNGKRFIDEKWALWTETDDLSDIIDDIKKLSTNKDLYNEYLKNGKEFIQREFDAEIIITEMIQEIKQCGKDVNKKSYDEFLKHVYKDKYDLFVEMSEFIKDTTFLPAINIKSISTGTIAYLGGKSGKKFIEYAMED